MVRFQDVKVGIIACVSSNNVIGNGKELVFDIKEDMAFFRAHTDPGVVIVARGTYEAMGRALPRRVTILVSRNPELQIEDKDVTICNCLSAAIEVAKAYAVINSLPTVYIIGGSELYAAGMLVADTMFITEVRSEAVGDKHFPGIDSRHWVELSRVTSHDNTYEYDFVSYSKNI